MGDGKMGRFKVGQTVYRAAGSIHYLDNTVHADCEVFDARVNVSMFAGVVSETPKGVGIVHEWPEQWGECHYPSKMTVSLDTDGWFATKAEAVAPWVARENLRRNEIIAKLNALAEPDKKDDRPLFI